MLHEKNPQIQRLLVPQHIPFSPEETMFFRSFQSTFLEMGFEAEIFPHGLMLHTIPTFVALEDLQQLLPEVLSDIRSGNTQSKSLEEVKNKIRAYTACRSAVKF